MNGPGGSYRGPSFGGNAQEAPTRYLDLRRRIPGHGLSQDHGGVEAEKRRGHQRPIGLVNRMPLDKEVLGGERFRAGSQRLSCGPCCGVDCGSSYCKEDLL